MDSFSSARVLIWIGRISLGNRYYPSHEHTRHSWLAWLVEFHVDSPGFFSTPFGSIVVSSRFGYPGIYSKPQAQDLRRYRFIGSVPHNGDWIDWAGTHPD